MQHIINEYIGGLKLGRKQSYKNLTVFALLSDYNADSDYLTLDEALSGNLIDVVEKNEGGSVPELKVVNRSDRMVLILDGEELVGAKQNRIVNTTILIAGKTTTVIPVSCVEQGRWSYKSAKFSSEKRMMASKLRARKADQVKSSLKRSGKFISNGHVRDLPQERPVHRKIRQTFRSDRLPGRRRIHDQRQGGRNGLLRKARNIFKGLRKTGGKLRPGRHRLIGEGQGKSEKGNQNRSRQIHRSHYRLPGGSPPIRRPGNRLPPGRRPIHRLCPGARKAGPAHVAVRKSRRKQPTNPRLQNDPLLPPQTPAVLIYRNHNHSRPSFT
jgi:hypothetical protein